MKIPGGKEAGFGLVEVMVALAIIAVGIVGLLGALLPAIQLSDTSRETTVAMNAARKMIVIMDRSWSFNDTFAMYNEDSADDPDGAGTAPGPGFIVEDLSAQPGDADGFVGRISFPGAGAVLREDTINPELGMPRDLNGDGVVDAADHSGNYIILPVTVFIEWQGASGLRSTEISTLLTER